MQFTVIIPARRASSRLPNKPLLEIAGLPMVIHTAQRARRSSASRVLIATDDAHIQATVQAHGFEAFLTRPDHPSGTDRLAEVVKRLELAPEHVVVNVQGDEPLIDPLVIDRVALQLAHDNKAAIATCASPIHDAQALFDPTVVKVVCRHNGNALYFSRAPIPWARDALAHHSAPHLAPGLPAWHHLGLYAYRVGFLHEFPKLPIGPLERYESLEQLRALENGYDIRVELLDKPLARGVDTPSDLERVRQEIKQIAS